MPAAAISPDARPPRRRLDVTDTADAAHMDDDLLGDTEVWLIRHGETEWSLQHKHTGSRTDLPLTERGEEKAAALREQLASVRFDLVLASPLQRARRTAELAGFPDAELTADLVEWDYGRYEGRTTADIHDERPEWYLWTDGCPDGESPDDVAKRVERVIDRCRSVHGRCLVVAHGHVLRSLAARWIDQPVELGAHLNLETARVSILADDRGIPTIERWNTPA
jgi:broad specificity phosphatase PhoE